MTTDAELDEKLARLGARVADRSASARERLAEIGALELAQALREAFQARCTYLGPDAGFPHGHAYNFDLRGHANAAADAFHGRTAIAPQRPVNEPYRGKPSAGQRKGRRAQADDRRRDPPRTWHDVQGDR